MPIIKIKNFLSLKDATVQLNALTLFIGPQAGGKSVISKLIYYFHCIPNILLQSTLNDGVKRSFDKEMKELFAKIFPFYAWSEETFKIIYETDVGNIYLSHNGRSRKNYIDLAYDEHYKKIIYQARALFKKLYTKAEKNVHEKTTRFRHLDPIEMVERQLSAEFSTFDFGIKQDVTRPIFIPSGRSFFANIQNNVFAFLSNNLEIDYFLKEFGATYNTAKRLYDFLKNKNVSKIKNIGQDVMSSVLGGEYFRESRKALEFIKARDGRITNIANASSGQQESLPMLIVLSSLPNFRERESNLYIIEEPEAHLFPSSQRQIIEMIVLLYNLYGKRNSYIITTHSPYVLGIMNLLAKAGRIRENIIEKRSEKSQLNKLDNIVPKEIQIERSSLNAYLISDGKAQNIIDETTGLVNDEVIDEVSESTAIKFDDLLDMEID